MKLQISSSQQQFLLDQAASSPNTEVCGLLLGTIVDDVGAVRIADLVPAANVAANPARSFEIAPATLLASHRSARAAGLRVIGHWHSHPNGSPRPSNRDAARATENGQIWLIIAGGTISGWLPHTIGAGPAGFAPVLLEQQ
ncbi:M67 family metallopeptidase [Sandarakinorhabdus sp.]|uniref:M67 family metallopeptidase n=1 Tax=Sandarakinorhabdus sp. TaxID=1916663 RepID=UPI00333F2BFE